MPWGENIVDDAVNQVNSSWFKCLYCWWEAWIRDPTFVSYVLFRCLLWFFVFKILASYPVYWPSSNTWTCLRLLICSMVHSPYTFFLPRNYSTIIPRLCVLSSVQAVTFPSFPYFPEPTSLFSKHVLSDWLCGENWRGKPCTQTMVRGRPGEGQLLCDFCDICTCCFPPVCIRSHRLTYTDRTHLAPKR